MKNTRKPKFKVGDRAVFDDREFIIHAGGKYVGTVTKVTKKRKYHVDFGAYKAIVLGEGIDFAENHPNIKPYGWFTDMIYPVVTKECDDN